MIEIPKSNAREQQENELVSWVLEKLETRKEVQILQRTDGCCAGNWVGSLPNEEWHTSSFEAVENVVRAFRRQGYSVTEHCSMRYPSAYINFRK
nr:MAG TPA: hypothetical protein [Caudoviricetes sp.]